MRHAYRLVPFFCLSILFLPFRAEGDSILVINSKDAPVEGKIFQNVQQFWYELGIASDRQEVLLTQPSPAAFFSLSEAEQFEAAKNLCENKNAYAAVWLTIADEHMMGFGMVVVSHLGKLARTVTFDKPMSSPQDAALIAKELLEHSLAYTDVATAREDGWTSLYEPPPIPAPPPPKPPKQPFRPLGKVIDDERPRKREDSYWGAEPPKGYTVSLLVNFSQGIASYAGPASQVGGEASISSLALERLFLKFAFAAEAGPFLQPSAGYSLSPIFGVGVPFPFRKVALDLWADAAAVFSGVSVHSEGYKSSSIKWWTFSARIGIGVTVPTTRAVAFVFRSALSTEYPGLRVMENNESGRTVLETPLLSLELAAGIRFLIAGKKSSLDRKF